MPETPDSPRVTARQAALLRFFSRKPFLIPHAMVGETLNGFAIHPSPVLDDYLAPTCGRAWAATTPTPRYRPVGKTGGYDGAAPPALYYTAHTSGWTIWKGVENSSVISVGE